MATIKEADSETSSLGGNFDSLPLIDLANLRSSRVEDRQIFARQIRDVCTQVGFFYIKVNTLRFRPDRAQSFSVLTLYQNHGIAEELIDGAHEAAKRFFSLPEEQKMECYMGKSKVTHQRESVMKVS